MKTVPATVCLASLALTLLREGGNSICLDTGVTNKEGSSAGVDEASGGFEAAGGGYGGYGEYGDWYGALETGNAGGGFDDS